MMSAVLRLASIEWLASCSWIPLTTTMLSRNSSVGEIADSAAPPFRILGLDASIGWLVCLRSSVCHPIVPEERNPQVSPSGS